LQILAITTSFPRGAGDPAGVFVEELASALRPFGLDTHVVALSRADVGALTTLAHGTLREKLSLLGRVVKAAPFALVRADVVLAHWLVPSAWLALVRRDRPVVGVAHGSDARLLCSLPRAVRKATVERLSGLIAVTPEIARSLEHPHTLITPMGTRVAAQTPRPSRGGPLEALFVGRLVQGKGLHVLIDAVAATDGVHLTVIGDGPERARYRPCDRVTFLGARSPAVVRDAMRAADVLCVPSLGAEGAPLVVQEAATVGLPVLASRLGGLPTVVPAAGLVPPGDVLAWREALLRATRAAVPPGTALTWDAVSGRVAGFLRDTVRRDRAARPSGGRGPRRA
jgi:glycosyltransferase involved in cell wall biosynthesis